MNKLGITDPRMLDFYQGKQLNFADITQDAFDDSVWDQEIKAFLEAQTLKGMFFNDDWVFIIVDLLADLVSTSPLVAQKEIIEGDEVTYEDLPESPAMSLLETPNPFQDYHSWMYLYLVEYLLMGNAIQWFNNTNTLMTVIPTETVSLDFDGKGNHAGYMVVRRDDFTISGQSQVLKIPLDQTSHQMRPNPASLLWGLSPFISGRKSILFNRYTQDYLNGFYLKGAIPGMILKLEKNVSEESALRFLNSFESAHTGRRNNRRTMILPKGVDAEPSKHSITDQNLLGITELNINKICRVLKVPLHAVGLAKDGSLGSEEHKTSLKFLYEAAVLPTQAKVARFLTRIFRRRGLLESDHVLNFDNSEVQILKEDLFKKAELGEKLKGQWSLNEIRVNVWKMEPVPGGDKIDGVSDVEETPEDEPDTNDPENNLDEDEGSDEGTDQNDKSHKVEYTASDGTLAQRKRQKEAISSKFGELIAESEKQLGREVDDKENNLVELYLNTFAAQAEKAAEIVAAELEKQPITTKAQDDIPAKAPIKKIRAKLLKELEKFADDTIEEQVGQLTDTMERSYGTQLRAIFDSDRLDAMAVIRDRDEEDRAKTLTSRGFDSFKEIGKTTTNRILDVIADGLEEKQTIAEITKSILKDFEEISPNRADMIARTEVLTAVSIGKAAAVENMQEVFEGETIKKVWISAGDSRVRDSHVQLDGDIIDADEVFDNGLRFPRDPKGPPEEVIRCRCDFLAVPETNLPDLDIVPDSEFE